MDIIKKYEKFKSYKTVFAVFLITLVVSLASGITLSQTSPEVGELMREMSGDIRLLPFFEICFFTLVFTAGPTIYAPTTSFATVAAYGILFGIRASDYFDSTLSFAAEIFFSSATAYLLVIYSSFVTLTSMRIFTDTKTNNKNELFDGVMFRAEKFRGIFNLKYILSYIMFFLLFAVFVGFFSVSKAFLLSL